MRAVATITPKYPQHLPELPDIATDSTAVVPAPERVFKDQIVDAAYAEAGIGPEDISLAEVYDLSTALELDWYEHLGRSRVPASVSPPIRACSAMVHRSSLPVSLTGRQFVRR
ncbi:lipid-transfer protein [Mycobacteroides abscessus subsp. abscessus]|nr:lipid-transfer protein [Mycobacteroides abscessus subsp. abscessus]